MAAILHHLRVWYVFFSFFRGVHADCLTYCVCVCYIRWYMIFDIWYVSLYYRWSMLYDLRYVFYDSCYNAYNIFRIHIRNPIKLKKPSVKWKQMHYTLHEITSLRIFCTIPQMKMFNNVYTNSMQSLCKIPSNPITPLRWYIHSGCFLPERAGLRCRRTEKRSGAMVAMFVSRFGASVATRDWKSM